MSPIPIPEDIKNQIDEAFVNLNSPMQLGESQLRSLSMVAQYEKENPLALPYQALKAVLTHILNILEEENPDYADILRGRFWEGLSPTDMMARGRPKHWAQKTFYNYQKKARNEFYSLLWQKEYSLRQKVPSKLLDDVESKEIKLNRRIGDKEHSLFRRLIFSSAWVYLFLALFAFAVASLFFVIFDGGKLPEKTPAPIIPTLTSVVSADHTSTPVNVNSLCGEREQIPLDFSTSRFVRSQGVSNFNVENTPGIINNAVRALAIDQTGIWIGYFGSDKNLTSGIGHYDKKSFANCDFSKVLAPQNINAIAVSESGKIWVGTEKNGVLSFDGKEWRLYTTRDGLPSNEIFELTIDEQENLWVGTWEGVAKFDGQNWSVPYQVQNDTIFNNHISSIAFDDAKNIWIGHIQDGISEYRQIDDKWISYTTLNEDGLAGDQIRSIIIRPQSVREPESVWFATADGGISRFELGKWTIYRVEDGLPSNDVSALSLDRYNRVWAATAKGVVYFDDKTWRIYNTIATSTIVIGGSCLDSPCPFDDDHVWTGTPGMGLTHSRLPLPDSVIQVTDVCFITSQRERVCPSFSLDSSQSVPVVTSEYPIPLKAESTLRFEITVSPEGTYELREDRGDFMSNTDEEDFNLFGAWPVIGVKGLAGTGQRYTFTDYDNPFVAPKLPEEVGEKQFISTWRLWMYTRYAGPYIRLIFTVKSN